MDVSSLAAAMQGACRTLATAAAAKMMKMNAERGLDRDRSRTEESGQLADAAAGLGQNLDISV